VHVGRAQAVRVVDDHDRAQVGQLVADLEQPLQELDVLDHRDPGPAVPGHVSDLLGRRGVVDRQRGAAGEHRTEVGDVELGPVAQEQQHPLAPPQSEPGERGRQPGRPVTDLGPGPLLKATAVRAHPPQGDLVAVLGDVAPQPVRNGRARIQLSHANPSR
jgi:hypothetical protein